MTDESARKPRDPDADLFGKLVGAGRRSSDAPGVVPDASAYGGRRRMPDPASPGPTPPDPNTFDPLAVDPVAVDPVSIDARRRPRAVPPPGIVDADRDAAPDPRAAIGGDPEPQIPGDEERALRRQRRRMASADGTPPPPQGPRGGGALPALRPEVRPDTPALRAERVEAIRRDLVRRRRRKGGGMVAKLLLFVLAPTLAVAWFLWFKATELYASDAVFLVQGAEMAPSGGGGILGAIGGGRGGSGLYDSVAVQSFILSRDVLKRLDDDHGFIAHFQVPEIDRLHRLAPDASFEEAYAFYRRMVSASFDPSEGVLELRVIATSAADAHRFASAIIAYAEEMVDALADPIRINALRDAETNLNAAESRLRAAQTAAAEIRKSLATFSVESELGKQTQIIAGMEVELEGLRGKLTNLRRVTSDNDPRVQRLIAQVETLTAQIAARQDSVTGSTASRMSLADINAEIERANFEVQAAMAIFSAAIEARETARKDAARQHRYLSVVVAPSIADRSNYPAKGQTVGLAFLICLGVYILASLTISLIREQASV